MLLKKTLSIALLKMSKFCPKHVELILEINKTVIVASRWFLYYLTYIDDARSNTNQVYVIVVSNVLQKRLKVNTFVASYLNTQGLNNSYLKSPASTLVDLTFQSRALRSFSLNHLRNLSL